MNAAGLLYADRYWKSLYNYKYWLVWPECNFMYGMSGIEKTVFMENAQKWLEERNVIQEGWMR
jgi:hypothetical protein